MPSRRALVTGCAGFIGSHLTESLLQDGYTVLGVDCFNDNYARADKHANLARATSLRCALEVLAGIAGRPLDVRHFERESGDVMDTGADTTRARDELGFAPRTTLEDGLAAELDWVRGRDARASRVRTLTAS